MEKLLPTFKNLLLAAMKIVKEPKHLFLLQQAYRRVLIDPNLSKNSRYYGYGNLDYEMSKILNEEPDSPYTGRCLCSKDFIVSSGGGIHVDIFGDGGYYVEIGITRKNLYSKTEFYNYCTADGTLAPKTVGEILKPRVTIGYNGDRSEYGWRGNYNRWAETVAGWPKLSKYIKSTVVSNNIECQRHLPEAICKIKEAKARKEAQEYRSYHSCVGNRWIESDYIASERRIYFPDSFKDSEEPNFSPENTLIYDVHTSHISCEAPEEVVFIRTNPDFSLPENIKRAHHY